MILSQFRPPSTRSGTRLNGLDFWTCCALSPSKDEGLFDQRHGTEAGERYRSVLYTIPFLFPLPPSEGEDRLGG